MPMLMARKKTMITLTLEPELVGRLKAWVARQRVPPAQNAVIALALTKFLDEEEAHEVASSKVGSNDNR